MVLVPAKGKMSVKITGDTLQGTVKTGLEEKESWTRIQNIDSIEILESPIYEQALVLQTGTWKL